MRLVSFMILPEFEEEGEQEHDEAQQEGREKLPRFGTVLEEVEMIVDLTAALPKKWQPLDAKGFLQKGEDAFRYASLEVVSPLGCFGAEGSRSEFADLVASLQKHAAIFPLCTRAG